MARFSDGDERQHDWYAGQYDAPGPDWALEWGTCRCCLRVFDAELLTGRYCRACVAELERDRLADERVWNRQSCAIHSRDRAR